MITKWYEIVCNNCGNANYFLGSIRSAESQYKSTGGIIIKKKHYCNIICQKEKKEKDKS